MSKIKKVEKIISPPSYHWVGDGFKVHTFFPSAEIDKSRMSPFYLLDYNAKTEFPPSETPRGVGPHPHRGLETVTISFHGKVAHHDSEGNSGVIAEGDVQWMTAGAGILHKEYHEKNFSQKGGLFQMVQLWVNLPTKHKMAPPNYQTLINTDIGKVQLPNDGGLVKVIAGQYEDISGLANTFTPLHIYELRLNKGADLTVDLPEDYNTGITVIEGNVQLNKKETAVSDQFVLFQNSGNDIKITALENSILLLLSGEPINEQIFQYGPFLMNTKSEIIEAFDDYNNGKFGHLE